ncbi:glycoside hydrolase family protein [Tenggerimyces flavus]|uniref:Uncharacterized protein n=1 Tax=Tenggerimyces flavus TaxID=1708749 RepID=A0ABV7YNC7_9ACTN|nr:hypothetical protein [Tenggerimyces flavus]MBM7784809.1 hypothetical protein [Tenggerimyces flavus]
MGRRALLGGVGGVLATGAFAPPAAALAPSEAESSDRHADSGPDKRLVGAGVHFIAQRKGFIDSQLRLLRDAEARAIRDEVHWAQVEVEKGVLAVPAEKDSWVRRAAAAGLEVLLILDYSNPFYDNYDRPTSDEAIAAFTRYATFLARHFKGVVRRFEIWNEWDIRIGGGGISSGGTPEDYMRLVRSVYPALKAVDPKITVAAGAMTNAAMFNGFLDATLANGLLDNCDVVAIHPYNWGDLPLDLRRPEIWVQSRIERVQDKLRSHNAGNDVPLYITEMSWPTQLDARGIAPDWAAAYCARSYLIAATLPYIKGYWWYDLQDDGWNSASNEHNFGLVRADDTPKPAFYAYAGISSLFANGRYEGQLATGDPEIWALRFGSPRSPDTLALWNSYMDDDWSVVLRDTRGNGAGELRIEQLGHPARRSRWGRREWYSGTQTQPVIPHELEITLRRAPVLISGNLDGVTITRVTKRVFPESQRP